MDKIEAKFREYHEANPHVYAGLKDLALRLKKRGRNHYGIAALFEVLRYERALVTVGDEFKLNNNYRALYAREIMENEKELGGFFATRARTSARMSAIQPIGEDLA